MPSTPETSSSGTVRKKRRSRRWRQARRRRILRIVLPIAGVLAVLGVGGALLGQSVLKVKGDLEAGVSLIPELKGQLLEGEGEAAQSSLAQLQQHTSAAARESDGPLWRAAAMLPWAGANFSAVADVAASVDNVVASASPLLTEVDIDNLGGLAPRDGRMDMEALQEMAPALKGLSRAVDSAYVRVERIDERKLLPQLTGPVAQATEMFGELRGPLGAAATSSEILPPMLGAEGKRNYLLLIQNSAEVRATGGIPGALAVIEANNGAIELKEQGSASDLGVFRPALEMDPAQEAIYSVRLGSYMQNVNLTPDFPTTAVLAKAMWEKRHPAAQIDGVVAVDVVVLSHLLEATGPVDLSSGALPTATGSLPVRLTGENVVKTLLSSVYAEIPSPAAQDEYFAAVAGRVFAALTEGGVDGQKVVEALQRSTAENRVLLWSGQQGEQDLIGQTPLSGAVTGPSALEGIGVYFNDGTGAKMDYYVKRTAQVQRRCDADGTPRDAVEVTLTNTAPPNAGQVLPRYVTGGGVFGVKEGNVRTNVVIYGPAEALVDEAKVDGKAARFGSYFHGGRPVAVLTVNLAPGASTTVTAGFLNSTRDVPPLHITPTIDEVTKVVKSSTVGDSCTAQD
ncbi:hypothetical protein NCCP1664_16340 [Zafaria cholistanensis]|uniref:DUF4012 domain-containing protein n=1 Tax=Zafaria cholistanensis TaxID=1682741 RepID=A0A5A7NTK1_9MICC|nr:DUF4012 domain-containing protein [Zafaria cholistanensis]GER23138.1 hypothetical protein NCCP1664_16340 [Zafaria cholistanensis]